MKQEFFFPIYQQIEKEFKELSYYISIDENQLKIYSIKIADLILRTVSECENIAKALCTKHEIKFLNKNGQEKSFINFHEYIHAINSIYNIEKKLISFDYKNSAKGTFDSKHQPFRKQTILINGKEQKIWSWYYAYNQIKHNRIENYKVANLENLIEGMAALFVLNIYYKNEVFYEKKTYDLDNIIQKIESFSDIFMIDYTVNTKQEKLYNEKYGDSFFNPASYFEIARPYSIYTLEYDKEIKTDSDKGADFLDRLEFSILTVDKNGKYKNKYENYKLKDYKSFVCIVGYIHKVKE